MGDAIREITVKIKTGKILRILSNDLDAPAQELADLYRRRWLMQGASNPLEATRLIRTNLMHRKDVSRLRTVQDDPPSNLAQSTFDLSSP